MKLKQKRFLGTKAFAGIAPTEILIFRPGENPTDNGPLLFDAEAARMVMEAYTARGIKLHFDYAHALPESWEVEDPDPQHQIAAGWFELEVRETPEGPELWAVNIQWTPRAKKAIEDLEWGYFSPWLYVEEGTNRVIELRNIGLTNDPAMNGINPVASILDRRCAAKRLKTTDMSFADITTALYEAIRARYTDDDRWGVYILEVYDEIVVYEKDDAFYQVSYSIVAGEAVLGDDTIEVVRTYVPAPTPPPPPPPELMTAAKQRSVDRRTHVPRHNPVPARPGLERKGTSTMERHQLMLALGLKTDATDVEVHGASANTVQRLLAITSARSANEALGRIEGWSKSARQLEDAQARLVQLERDARNRHIDELINKGIADKKITVGMEPELRAIGQTDPERLAGLISTMPIVFAMRPETVDTGNAQVGVTANASGKRWEELSFSQKAAMRKKNPELAKALQEEHASRTAV